MSLISVSWVVVMDNGSFVLFIVTMVVADVWVWAVTVAVSLVVAVVVDDAGGRSSVFS